MKSSRWLLVSVIGIVAGCNGSSWSDVADVNAPQDVADAMVNTDAMDRAVTPDSPSEAATESGHDVVDVADIVDAAMDVARDVPVDTTADASDATPDGPALPTCGAAPYIEFSGQVTDFFSNGGVAGVTVTSNNCPGMSFAGDATGNFDGLLTSNTPLYGRFAAAGYVPLLTPEVEFVSDALSQSIQMITTTDVSLVVAGYSTSTATIIIPSISPNAATGACASSDGITFTVMNHSEAHVQYYLGPAPSPVPTATTTMGQAAISGLMPTSSIENVTIVGTKTGCMVLFAYPNSPTTPTGNIPIEAGSITAAYPIVM